MTDPLILGADPGTMRLDEETEWDRAPGGLMMPASLVQTDEGPVPAEWLRAGDRVLTRDRGFQPLIWVGRKKIADAQAPRAVLVDTSALTDATPRQTALLHPDTKVLIRARRPQSRLDLGEVLCRAGALLAAGRAQEVNPEGDLKLCTLFFADHEIILADDIWLSSARVTPQVLADLTPAERESLRFRLGLAGIYQPPARKAVSNADALAVLGLPDLTAKAEAQDKTSRKRVANG